MSDSKNLFRKAALEKQSSPEQLDSLMQITSPVRWLALLSSGCIIVIIIIWGIFGEIPDKLNGQGILTKGVFNIKSETDGIIVKLEVTENIKINKGQVIAEIEQEEIDMKIKHKKAEIVELITLYKQELKTLKYSINAQKNKFEVEKINIKADIKNDRSRIEVLEKQVKKDRRALNIGAILEHELEETKNKLANKKDEMHKKQGRLKAIDSERIEPDMQIQEKKNSHSKTLHKKENELRELEQTYKTKSKVVSQYEGRIVEINVEQGGLVKAGDIILTLENETKELVAVFFTPANAGGKKIKTNMNVLISPSIVNAAEHGFIRGVVKSVSPYPATDNRLRFVLKNDKLVDQFLRSGAPFEVGVKLVKDKTESGYKWTSRKGPPISIESGTSCDAFVIVGTKRPIEYVINKINELITFFQK